jgi:magnesium-transporting ATPase (P-type)
MSRPLDSYEKVIVAWCITITVGTVAVFAYVLMYQTDPTFFTTAVVQSLIIVVGICFFYWRLARAVLKRSVTAPKENRLLLLFLGGLAGVLFLFSFLPDSNRDAFAAQRYSYGVALLAFFAAMHWLFHRDLRHSFQDRVDSNPE